MLPDGTTGLFAGAVALGLVHGVEPGHGWPVAASYAVDRSHRWLAGLAASTILGVGHLVSSIAVVLVFFSAKSYFSLTQVNEPLSLWGVQVGGPIDVVAGVLLVALGVREYRHGHHGHGGERSRDTSDSDDERTTDADHPKFATGHAHGAAHDHRHGDDHGHDAPYGDGHGHGHSHDHGHSHGGGLRAAILRRVPFVEETASEETAGDRGLWGIAGFAFVLGFAHEEEFEIIALCTGSSYCLELMLVYAAAVLVGIVALTLLLVAGYTRSERRVRSLTPYLPAVSASVLVGMGLGFLAGVF